MISLRFTAATVGKLVVKMLLVSLAFLTLPNGQSLGIGIDVLPEAYDFAARRVGFSADLRLETCTVSRCLWALGDGVKITADRTRESLDIFRIEATLDRGTSELAKRRYEQACLAIVALVQRNGDVAELRAAAKAISSPPDQASREIQVDLAEHTISLYGALTAGLGNKDAIVQRCGAIAS